MNYPERTVRGILVRRGAICWLAGIALSGTAVLLVVFADNRSETLDWPEPRALLAIPVYILIGVILTTPIAIMMQLVVMRSPHFFARFPILAGIYAALVSAAAGFAILYILGVGEGWLATAKIAVIPAFVSGGLFGLWGRMRPLDSSPTAA